MIHKRNNPSIAIASVAVAMLLFCSIVSCSRAKKEEVEIGFNPDSTYTMKAVDVVTLVSDSGVTRYKVETHEWYMFGEASEPYWYFPKKLHLEKFDSLFRVEASVDADTAYFYQRRKLWKLIGNVRVRSLQGEQFETSVLYWDQNTEKIYSDQFIRITKGEFVNTGQGFESNQALTQYRIFNSAAEIPFDERSSSDSMGVAPPLPPT